MSSSPMERAYNPSSFEDKWYRQWEQSGYFLAGMQKQKPRFSIVIPPPNVTGSLHMGHALQHTLHDVLVRWKRMLGWNVLWLPGTDHAGIATQNVVEKQLMEKGLKRQDMGREAFEKTVWEWKAESGNTITRQMRLLGTSCDWSRERFTLDEGLSRAVREVFVRLYQENLIYRDEYIVNWCPRCGTAISDLEVDYKQTKGHLYYVRYPLVDSAGSMIVATTRPETMLGDTAVAVHPEDSRFRHLSETASVRLPIVGRILPIVRDTFVSMEFGTGAVKITPAHDPNDFQVGHRHHLPEINVMTADGHMSAEAGAYAGMDRFACRKQILEELKQLGLLEKIEEHVHNVGHCQRCHTMVEPRLSTQWFVRIKPLAEEAIRVVEEGKVTFLPENFGKIYFEWMHNIHDWCISRQLWWGHRIPAWFCQDCHRITVSRTDPSQCEHCQSSHLQQESDVLDTWFSSALWPFSTLGWPDEDSTDLKLFYPTDLLITGPDIIFFWVARMIMMGMKFIGDVPFRKVFLNGIVRDERKQKMSKTKGNIINPLDIIDQYGADAVRFTLAALSVPGTDIPFSTDRMKGYSAFANKIWNAARFALMNLSQSQEPVDTQDLLLLLTHQRERFSLPDRWILHRLNRATSEMQEALENFRFDEGTRLIYRFIWNELCDWYLELIKPSLSSDSDAGHYSRITLTYCLDQALRLLHPFMPFITEEIWQRLPHRGDSIMIASFPQFEKELEDGNAEEEISLLMDMVGKIRNLRSELNIEPGRRMSLQYSGASESQSKILLNHSESIRTLCRLDHLEPVDSFAPHLAAAKTVVGSLQLALLLQGVRNIDEERLRLEKEEIKLRQDLEKIAYKLESQDFLDRAPREVVEENQRRRDVLKERLITLGDLIQGLRI